MLKVMTFNIKNKLINFPKDQQDRLNGVINIIKKELPDVVGLQEVTKKTKKIIENKLEEYYVLGNPRLNSIKYFEEYNTVLIKKNDIKVLEYKTIHLFNKHKHDFFSFCPRICTYVKICYKGHIIDIINTHLDHVFNYTRRHQLMKISEIINKIGNEATIIMGDFNMTPQNKNIINFIQNRFNNISFEIHESTIRQKWRKQPIDHILISKNITFYDLKLIKNKVDNKYPSDHYPIVVTLKLSKEC